MSLARASHPMRDERGYTLIEMLVVIVILAVVLTGLTTVFVQGSSAELRLNRRFQAQEQARLALTKFRLDAHCAAGAQAQTIGTYPGVKLAVSNCYSVATTVSWCAVQVGTAARYQLYRSTATANICTSSDTTRQLVADYITTTTNLFTTASIPQYALQTIGVDFKVSVNPTTTRDVYELSDAVVARNYTPRCTSTSATWVSASSTCTPPSVP